MSSLGTKHGILEAFKFGVYIGVPVFLMYAVANNPKSMQWLMQNHPYVVYPPEGPRPPSPEEIREIAKKMRNGN